MCRASYDTLVRWLSEDAYAPTRCIVDEQDTGDSTAEPQSNHASDRLRPPMGPPTGNSGHSIVMLDERNHAVHEINPNVRVLSSSVSFGLRQDNLSLIVILHAIQDSPMDRELGMYNWYVGEIKRTAIETVLHQHPPGTYLVRRGGAHVIFTVKQPAALGDFNHIKILVEEDGTCSISDSESFKSIPELVRFYHIYWLQFGQRLWRLPDTQLPPLTPYSPRDRTHSDA
ncbi:uncharacterized protein MONBRDRAFT_8549 [Monosiga brevicollis MX1]|uniref:SH2 domain-containing protein n=1 Tax=Monosiga brevicollis TaxID=81824 RepID=A9V0C9_MONBE|nr:uncharacterized protein MONBRDRAFT_8549 [Monosiga brevicollis MX1]EDQ88989.1 predicted protein [Monosiga brevicollis MX1]|eukprot:XP_001746094.1 hypothetical protein [Monosiga brevicollis MX1]